jgi:hypothetical protein
MNTHTRKNLKPWLVPAALLLFITGLFVARTAFARLVMNTVVGLARSSINGQATDAHQWLVNVTLLRE